MNLYALLVLCASAVSICLGLSVYFLNRKATVNRLFMLTMLANAYWAFGEFMLSQSTTVEVAIWWDKALFLWPFLVALMLHFSLAFTESDLLKRRLTYLLLYLPALAFSLIDLTTNLISGVPDLKPWGYSTSISLTIVSRMDGVWAALFGLLTLFFLANYYNRVKDKIRKRQTIFITVAFGIPIFLSLIIDSILPVAGIDFPVLGNISGSATAFIVLYAMMKYGLFNMTSEIAAENVFSTMPDSLLLLNLDGKIVKVNQSLLTLAGYEEKEIIGKPIWEILRKSNVLNKDKAPPKILEQLRIQREIKNYEISFYSKAGQKRVGALSCSMVSNNRGEDVGTAFVFHDLTEYKDIEEKLLKAERMASIGELASILGHDLRNPLSGIRGAAYFLRRKYSDAIDGEDLVMFESIDKSINYSNKIINDLIEFSSEINLDLQTVTPKLIVKGALAMVAVPANIKVIDFTQTAPQIRVDEDKISRTFMHIMKNSFDAMPNGGELTITSQETENTVMFVFKDNGEGISEDTLNKLWNPLVTTKAKGMGFGLPISKRTIEAHNGKISVESKLGNGTTVKVELPLNRTEQKNRQPP